MFNEARLKCRTTPDIIPVLWAKAAYNAALNPLSAIHGLSYGELLKNEETKSSMRRVVEELYAVAKAEGVKMDPPTSDGYVDVLFNQLIPITAEHKSSMIRAVETGQRTELDVLNGAIIRLGQTHGIQTPENQRLVDGISMRSKQVVEIL